MLTNADFAERACYLAKNIADWAGNSLTLRERMNEPMPAEALGRFTQYVRERLASLEESAAPEKPPFACNCERCPHPSYCRANFTKCPVNA